MVYILSYFIRYYTLQSQAKEKEYPYTYIFDPKSQKMPLWRMNRIAVLTITLVIIIQITCDWTSTNMTAFTKVEISRSLNLNTYLCFLFYGLACSYI